ncbi:hypothetical protein PLEOSDRAFT_1106343 [Pleurotus ostreatus PC15]|uniref:Uncharacterized protein n=1 Tax=Pleurotus ostreatus (strain PC15) TaxID=1137138 RepID=A0A067NC47_PLEO1|nr:hypothetical protein PLEOSDRAFT_1106343 [Pleurotus ostreatus PC15]
MPSAKFPLIDPQNPLYCPAVSPSSYLSHLRGNQGSFGDQRTLSRSFARLLVQALDAMPSVSEKLSSGSLYAHLPPLWEYDDESTLTVCDSDMDSLARNPHKSRPSKRKRLCDDSGTFLELKGPSKYARSCPSVHDSSFEVGLTRDTLRYSGLVSSPPEIASEDTRSEGDRLRARIRILEGPVAFCVAGIQTICAYIDALRGPVTGTETPRGIKSFIEHLDSLMPGIRLKDRIYALSELSHQGILDFLGNHGLLTYRILDTFRMSEIRFLSLDKSLARENGLNLGSYDTLSVLGKPDAFLFLSELSLNGAQLRDIDILNVHHLPRLSSLFLEETGVGNETIFHLTALKRTLAFLSLSRNPAIDDDSVPALLVLTKLEYLCLVGTGVRMPGLRRFANAIWEDDRTIRIDCPAECEKYISRVHTKYLTCPAPPLVVAPEVCGQLSAGALKRNLAAHAIANPTIFAGGNKQEMMIRLKDILEMRRSDLLVRDLILGVDEDGDVED